MGCSHWACVPSCEVEFLYYTAFKPASRVLGLSFSVDEEWFFGMQICCEGRELLERRETGLGQLALRIICAASSKHSQPAKGAATSPIATHEPTPSMLDLYDHSINDLGIPK